MYMPSTLEAGKEMLNYIKGTEPLLQTRYGCADHPI